MSKAAQGLALVVAGLVLAIGAVAHRASVQSDHEYDQQVAILQEGFTTGRLGEPEPFDNAPYIAVWAISGLLFMGGVVLYAAGRD